VALKNDPEPESDESSDDDLSEDLPEDSAEEGVQSPSRKRRSLSDGSRTPSKRKRLDDDVRKVCFRHRQSLTVIIATSSRVKRGARPVLCLIRQVLYVRDMVWTERCWHRLPSCDCAGARRQRSPLVCPVPHVSFVFRDAH